MALIMAHGFTDDGLVWLKAEDPATPEICPMCNFKANKSYTLTMEPDQANNLGVQLQHDAKKANKAKNRPLVIGAPVTIKKER